MCWTGEDAVATAPMGQRAAMACTVAVEDVIDDHYARQSEKLGGLDLELKAAVDAFRAEEIEHRETALAHGAAEAPGYPVLTAAIRAACRLAIKLSEAVQGAGELTRLDQPRCSLH